MFSCIFLTAGVSSVTGYKGRPVTINCAYKDDVKHKKKYISSSTDNFEYKTKAAHTWEHYERLSLYADPTSNTLMMTIRNLIDEDEKTGYRCSVDVRWYPDRHSDLNLKVLDGKTIVP